MRHRFIAGIAVAAALAAAALPRGAAAVQRPLRQDTAARLFHLDSLVVTADRAPTRLADATAAIARIDAADLRRLPGGNLAGALALAPGFVQLDFDGMGFDPQLMVRGFYGGGEAEYALVLLNGRPLNSLHAGLLAWDLLPRTAVHAIEAMRGGASALHGDAAIGGVINIVTAPTPAGLQWDVSAAGHGSLRAGLQLATRTAGRDLMLFGGGLRTDGFRDHAGRSAAGGGLTYTLVPGEDRGLTVSLLSHRRAFDLPGPVTDAAANRPTMSEPFFRFDRSEEWRHFASLDGRFALGSDAVLRGSLGGDLLRQDVTRTLPLTPEFADTRARELRTGRLAANGQLEWSGVLPWTDRLIVGGELATGDITSAYRAVQLGTRDDYAAATGEVGPVETRGSGTRRTAALFAQYEVRPVPALRVSLGARYDRIADAFDPDIGPSTDRLEADHSAFSPKLGLNVRVLGTARHTANVYVTAGRSFRAPTLDQLFDQRLIPVPVPPFVVATSNPLLEPQTGSSVEAGLYHSAVLVPGSLTASLSLAAYRMDMKNELDFDVQTLRYINIGRSRHGGLEAGVRLNGPAASLLFLNYTLQSATSRFGAFSGNSLKAIPRHSVTAGVAARPIDALETGLFLTRAGRAWLDDANTERLPGWTRIDARAGFTIRGIEIFAEARNLFDASYNSTAFPDPSGSEVVFLYPAAGRTLMLGFRSGT